MPRFVHLQGLADSNVVTVTINVLDAQAPSVTASVAVPVLWPPNHNLVNVGFGFSAADNGCGSSAIHLDVFSDEPDVPSGGEDSYFRCEEPRRRDARDVEVGKSRSEERAPRETRGLLDRIVLKRISYQSTVVVTFGESAYFEPDHLKMLAISKVVPVHADPNL